MVTTNRSTTKYIWFGQIIYTPETPRNQCAHAEWHFQNVIAVRLASDRDNQNKHGPIAQN